MNDLRKAAQQALQAMQFAGNAHEFASVAADLEAALAEPEQPEMGPVAKVEYLQAGGNAGIATRIVEIEDPLRERLRVGTLLYTAPTPRKPDLEALNAELVEALRSLVTATEGVSINEYNEEAHDIAVSRARAALAKVENDAIRSRT